MGALLNRRRYMGGGSSLPYDAEIEYIQTTKGTGLYSIDLDMTANEATDAVEIEFHLIEYNTQNRFFSSGDDSDAMEVYISGGRQYSWHRAANDQWGPNTGIGVTTSYELVEKYKVDWYNKTYTIRGVTNTFSAPKTPPSSPKLMIFDSLTGSMGCPGVQIYSVKVWREDVLVRDMIPVRVGTKGYLYDCISRRLFGNSGSSDFILGQDLGEKVDLQYLELTGAQWINTMVSLANVTDWEFEFDFAPTRFYNYNRIHTLGNDPNEESFIRSTGNLQFRYNGVASTEFAPTLNTRGVLKAVYSNSTLTIYFDGVQKSQKSANVTKRKGLLWLFRLDSLYAEMLFYGCKLSINNNLVLNLIPIRLGQLGIIYNTVDNSLFHNLGTAPYVLGPDKT